MPTHITKNKTLSEIFVLASQAETKQEKIAILNFYKNKEMQFIVNGLYNIDWSNLKIPISFTKDHRHPSICYSNISKSIERIYSAYRISLTHPARTEKIIQLVLESVPARDAELLESMFSNRKIDGISKSIFKKVFPELF